MDELKNLVIQTLETNGILGQLRAQLRSCVFKVIDNQEQIEKGHSGFHWENPNAKKVLSTATGVLCAELIRDFLEFYKLDYTLAIFMPEVNLSQQNALSKDELSKKVGLSSASSQKPLMAQLVEGFLANEGPSGSSAPASLKEPKKDVKKEEVKSTSVVDKFDSQFDFHEEKKAQPETIKAGQKAAGQPAKKDETQTHLDRANRILEEQKREEKSGYRAEIPSFQDKQKAKKEDDIIDTYGDDFEEEIEEDLPEDNHLGESNDNVNAHKNITESLGGITVSQSLGVDPSVDSLALEDYDHIEPVERIS